jgi:SAM-dependent methyltransferase
MKMAVGSDFEAIGLLEVDVLKAAGLRPEGYVVDVGCGFGRLAIPLARYLNGGYLGIDIVPDLVAYARRQVARPDWRFKVARGLTIPVKDGAADVVCFFSVFTHLLHEQSFSYLREAARATKPGGAIVVSFLEFAIPGHWEVFETTLRRPPTDTSPLNVFLSRDALRVWAERLELKVESIDDGDEACVPLSRPIRFEDGSVVEGMGSFGQSICVLRKGERNHAPAGSAASGATG